MQTGLVRIIAGKWRGRKLKVLDMKGLRPTPDRVRETLFNWLAPSLPGAHCLDLFAGSGVLGFEALSRGAASVEMIDASAQIVAHLQTEAQTLQAENLLIRKVTVPEGLLPPTQVFDIVFVDPPYQANLLLPTCHHLEDKQFLAPQAIIYLEADRPIEDNELPQNWRLLKKQKAGQVFYHLAQRIG
jgi:16S rRNA (guanine966-N2)-methyltransferase